jgi:P-type Ca2+ transporter type 2C
MGLLSNQPLLGAIVLTLGFHSAILYMPLLQNLFQTTALSLPELLLCLCMSSLVFWANDFAARSAIEGQKWLRRIRPKTSEVFKTSEV